MFLKIIQTFPEFGGNGESSRDLLAVAAGDHLRKAEEYVGSGKEHGHPTDEHLLKCWPGLRSKRVYRGNEPKQHLGDRPPCTGEDTNRTPSRGETAYAEDCEF